MGDVISVEVDGELGEPRFDSGPRRPRWGPPAAVGLVALLVAGLAWTQLGGSGGAGVSAPTEMSTPTSAPGRSPTTGTPLVIGGDAESTATSNPPSSIDPVSGARAALVAWGEFAATGDLELVRSTFAPGGPQLRQLEIEAPTIVAPADPSVSGYVVTFTDETVDLTGTTATVTGNARWSRRGEPVQQYRWVVELHQGGDGAWRLFNVRTVAQP